MRLLVDDKLEAVKAPVDAPPPTVRLPVGERLEADNAPVQARLPAVKVPETLPFPATCKPLLLKLWVVNCPVCNILVTIPFVASRPRLHVTGRLRLIVVVVMLSSKVATLGSMEEPPEIPLPSILNALCCGF